MGRARGLGIISMDTFVTLLSFCIRLRPLVVYPSAVRCVVYATLQSFHNILSNVVFWRLVLDKSV
jgi:hypothetical protein